MKLENNYNQFKNIDFVYIKHVKCEKPTFKSN